MKTEKTSDPRKSNDTKYHWLVPLHGFPRYYVDRMNRIISFHQSAGGRVVKPRVFGKKETVQLKRPGGGYTARTCRKLLCETLGTVEYLRREENRKNEHITWNEMDKEYLSDYYAAQYEKVSEEARMFREEGLKEALGDLY